MKSKTILYIAMSKDGFIAGDNDAIDFLNPYQIEGEDYGYANFIKSVGSIIVGRRTYEKVIGMGYPYHEDKKVYVITRNSKPSKKNLDFYSGDLNTLIEKLKHTTSGNIYCDGGAELAKTLLGLGLIDEIIISIVPVHLKSGTLLFKQGIVPSEFNLLSTKEYQKGLIQYSYQLNIK